jgi:hypothetical protein
MTIINIIIIITITTTIIPIITIIPHRLAILSERGEF